MAKKQWNARLTEQTILAIKVAAAERHCSEAEVIEFWASGSSGVTGNTVACDAAVSGSSPALPTIPAGLIAPKGSFKMDDLRALISAKPDRVIMANGQMQDAGMDSGFVQTVANAPQFPFMSTEADENVQVSTVRGKYLLIFTETSGSRFITEAYMLELWAKRTTP